MFNLDKTRDRLRGNLQHLLPDEPNATRIRYTGGTENDLDEWEGRTEERLRFKALVSETKEDRELMAAGDGESIRRTVYTDDDILELDDVVELDDETLKFEVRMRNVPRLNTKPAYCQYHLQSLQ